MVMPWPGHCFCCRNSKRILNYRHFLIKINISNYSAFELCSPLAMSRRNIKFVRFSSFRQLVVDYNHCGCGISVDSYSNSYDLLEKVGEAYLCFKVIFTPVWTSGDILSMSTSVSSTAVVLLGLVLWVLLF